MIGTNRDGKFVSYGTRGYRPSHLPDDDQVFQVDEMRQDASNEKRRFYMVVGWWGRRERTGGTSCYRMRVWNPNAIMP